MVEERGGEKGSGLPSTLPGRERSMFSQTNIYIGSRTTMGGLLRDGVERVWAFLGRYDVTMSKTEAETVSHTLCLFQDGAVWRRNIPCLSSGR